MGPNKGLPNPWFQRGPAKRRFQRRTSASPAQFLRKLPWLSRRAGAGDRAYRFPCTRFGRDSCFAGLAGDYTEQEPGPDHGPQQAQKQHVDGGVEPDISLPESRDVGSGEDEEHVEDEDVKGGLA